MLRRYLIEYDFESYDWREYPHVPLFVGVTAYSLEDALNLVARWILKSDEWPPVKRVLEDYDMNAAVEYPWGSKGLCNLGVCVWRGIWWPALNLFWGADYGHNPPPRPGARRATAEDVELITRKIVDE
jgi:hypothetical protein